MSVNSSEHGRIYGGSQFIQSLVRIIGSIIRGQIYVHLEEMPRKHVTRESHGFLTRDGITPSEFGRIAEVPFSHILICGDEICARM